MNRKRINAKMLVRQGGAVF